MCSFRVRQLLKLRLLGAVMSQKLVSPISVVKGGSSVSWADGIPILGDIINYFSNKSTNAANAQMVADTNANNYRIAQETNAMNQAINEQNIALTREQNQINRDREDNAVRRRVNDLVGAGLSKTLAAGSPASANAMAAPQATQGMQTGHEMKSAKYEAFRSSGLAASASLAHDSVLAQKEYDLKSRDLDLQEARIDEEIRHNKEMESQGSRGLDISERYADLQDKWNKLYYDQNSKFHDDAVKLENARNQISYLEYLSDDSKNKAIEALYQSEIDFNKVTTEQNAMRLTAEVAESAARAASYYADVKLSEVQLNYLKAQIPYIAAATGELVARKRNYDADTKNVLIDRLTKVWNLFVATRDKSKTNDTTVGESVAAEARRSRGHDLLSNLTKGLGFGVSLAFGVGGGNHVMKVLGIDEYDPFGMRSMK